MPKRRLENDVDQSKRSRPSNDQARHTADELTNTTTLDALLTDSKAPVGRLKTLLENDPDILFSSINRADCIEIMSALASALHTSDSRNKIQLRGRAPCIGSDIWSDDVGPPFVLGPCDSLLLLLPEALLERILGLIDARSLAQISCIKQFHSQQGLMSAAAADIFLSTCGRIPFPRTRPAWHAICIQQDADAAVTRWLETPPAEDNEIRLIIAEAASADELRHWNLYRNLRALRDNIQLSYGSSQISPSMQRDATSEIQSAIVGTGIRSCPYGAISTALGAIARVVVDYRTDNLALMEALQCIYGILMSADDLPVRSNIFPCTQSIPLKFFFDT